VSGGAYSTWPTGPLGNTRACDVPNNTAPVTLWNCFNQDSFGQVFLASATGTLSNVTMPMTCLNPARVPLTGLYAVLYQVNSGNASIPATPLAVTAVDLTTCPTLTSWSGLTFSAGNFAQIPIPFSGVTLTSGNFYAIYFAGNLVPGTPAPGFSTLSVATAGQRIWHGDEQRQRDQLRRDLLIGLQQRNAGQADRDSGRGFGVCRLVERQLQRHHRPLPNHGERRRHPDGDL